MSQIGSKLKELNKNNKGMSIVTVVVAIGFVAILVSIVMISSVINFRMKSINVYSKDAFYSAEQVLDEINVGLEKMVSDGLSQSYTSVMENYATEDMSSTEKNEKVKAEFYEYIWKQLGVDKKDGKYIVMSSTDPKKGIYGLLKTATKWNTTDSYGAFLRSTAHSDVSGETIYTGEMISTKDNGIVLKDLTVYYKDSSGFISAVKTDVRLVYPNFTFSNTNIPDIADYALITDTKLSEKQKNVTRKSAYTLTIKGNSYAYAVDTTGVIIDYVKNEKKGDLHIVATDMNVINGGIKTNENSVLWARDIAIRSGKVDLSGYTYVEDDMDISGKGSEIVFKGYYNGYGNSTNASETSSAILVNGIDTTVDLTSVKKLTLAGRAYVSTTGADKNPDADAKEFYTGESIAVKSDQLMYMVPAECIGVELVKDADGKVSFGVSNVNYGNPMSETTYAQMQQDIKDGKCVEIALNKKISKLGGTSTLGDFIADEDAVEKRIVRSTTGGSNVITYYMKFKSDEAANLYFSQYYNANGNQFADSYLKAITFPTDASGNINYLKVDMAGAALNSIKADADSNKKFGLVGYRNTYAADTVGESFAEDYIALSDQFLAYSTMLTPDLYSLQESPGVLLRSGDNQAVFTNLVDEEVLKDIGSTTFEKEGLKVQFIYAAKKDDMRAAAAGCDLIIANCGVDLSAYGDGFKGTILAKGEIKVPAKNFKFESNPEEVEKCMLLTSDDEVYKVSDVFADADEVEVKSVVNEKYDDASMDSLVMFENWTKNVEIK